MEGRADSYQEEGGAALISMNRHQHQELWWVCNTKALLQGLSAWQNELFLPSLHNHCLHPVLNQVLQLLPYKLGPRTQFG